MAEQSTLPIAEGTIEGPEVLKIGPEHVRAALAKGLDDFLAFPTHVLFLGLIYPVVGLVLARLAFGYDVLPLLFPLTAGFALIGPFAAIALYDVSRMREQGERPTLAHALGVLRAPSIGSIVLLGLVLTAVFVAWLAVADAIYEGIFANAAPASIGAFLGQVLGTSEGLRLILLGCGVGFLFALFVFVISVVAFPLMLDRNVGVALAVTTSVRAVLANPGPMALWAGIIVAGLVIGTLPFFMGLAVTVPVLGHASWHLYRAVVAQ